MGSRRLGSRNGHGTPFVPQPHRNCRLEKAEYPPSSLHPLSSLHSATSNFRFTILDSPLHGQDQCSLSTSTSTPPNIKTNNNKKKEEKKTAKKRDNCVYSMFGFFLVSILIHRQTVITC